MKPFKESENFTMVHNYLFDHVMPKVKPNAWKVLCCILRNTAGWKAKDGRRKLTDKLSYSQLREYTGIASDGTLRAALMQLLEEKYIKCRPGRKWDANVYGINWDYEAPTTEIVVEPATEIVVAPTTEIVDTKERERNSLKKDNGVAANDTPPAPSQPKAIDHPYVQAYREVFQRYPAKAQIAKIAKMIVTPPGTERFTAACEAWLMRGYNVTRLDGILEWYRDGVPSYQNGKSRRRTTVPAEPYQPPTQAEIDAARSAPTLEF